MLSIASIEKTYSVIPTKGIYLHHILRLETSHEQRH
jgi:hypothetical protein